MGYWEGEEAQVGGESRFRSLWTGLLPVPPQTNPPPGQIRPLGSGQRQEKLTWGLSRASSSIFCHISSLSFIRNRPLREQRQDGAGVGWGGWA